MLLSKIEINNFRNLNNITIDFSSKINFIVGENNIGKTNLIYLLDKIFNKEFDNNDYNNPGEKISIRLVMDNDYTEEKEEYFITSKLNEKMRITNNNGNIINRDIIKDIIFKTFSINKLEKTSINVTNIIKKYYDEFIFDNTLLMNASILIISEIEKIKNDIKRLSYIKNNKVILPLILALDEPEIHLHPYMQRRLISYYKKILSNLDDDFLKILKNEFNIDELCGQLIVVTHSTDALSDDYRSIIRFYKYNNRVYTVSGKNIKFPSETEKHLLMMFLDIKEAFFCRKAIIVEGITEFGAFKGFASSLDVDFDKYGICLINAQGEGSIKKLKELLDKFKIINYQVYDRDVLGNKMIKPTEFYTKTCCFEMEIVDYLVENKKFEILNYICSFIPRYKYQLFDQVYCKKCFGKINYKGVIKEAKTLDKFSYNDKQMYKAVHFTWLYHNKGVFLGRFIGNTLDKSLIPDVYKNAILECIK